MAQRSVIFSGAQLRGRHKPLRYYLQRLLIYAVVAVSGTAFMFPFFWAVLSSGKSPAEIAAFPPTWWPQNNLFVENYAEIWRVAPFGRWIINSVVITALNLAGSILSAALVAYSFARFRYRGRDTWFFIMLATMMIPTEVRLIPSYLIFNALKWVNSIKPLVVPAWFGGSAFNIFLLRQFYMTVPREMDEAAVMDGAGTLLIFFRILLPLAKPAIATAAALGFIGSWNNFMGPLIYLTSEEKFTAVQGLRYFALGSSSAQLAAGPPKDNLLMAASVVVALPCLILFFVAQKYFVQGIATTGIKG
ncbi:MAG: carbohydrate ABC transporter permease [Anaerolineae bacterium]|nr:carbohydrate ABC transporter permease [Anaerolineae bacterium]